MASQSENVNLKKKVAIVGAGLVGTLEACYMAKRGYDVHLYEARDDIRTLEHVPGRSINLAMSIRGRTGLKDVGVEQKIIDDHGIPMRGRMIHNTNGTCSPIPYNKDGKCIYSVGRRYVNEVLLSRAEEFPNVTLHFMHKLTGIDLDKGEMEFQITSAQENKKESADLVIGCDGAYSTIRKHMLKRPHFNYKQQYIPHGYLELCIPATSEGEFAMPPNFLHIWPRGEYMMIALPNQDKSWTVTLFMPFDIFNKLTSAEKLVDFFETNYPDAINLIGREKLQNDFFANKPLPMISVKCNPYHVGSRSLILGDAAHAMVPFYGQGMNCGMEDCVVFNELLDIYKDDFTKVLPIYSVTRNPDAEAIVDLAMYNYVEMRDLVNSKMFLLRKKWDNLVYTIFPHFWVPLYTMVTFSRERYHQCINKKKWQDKMVQRLLYVGGFALSVVSSLIIFKNSQHFSYPEFMKEIVNNVTEIAAGFRMMSK